MEFLRWPQWLKEHYKNKKGDPFNVSHLIKLEELHTVCQEAHCPNIRECFGSGKATFLIMGNTCTRNCRFCNIDSGIPGPLDFTELDHLIETIKIMKLRYIVVTSVTRDDIEDGGASFFSRLAFKIKQEFDNVNVEFLIPDFQGKEKAMEILADAPFEILNHNIETVPRLYADVRPQADFERSLKVLRFFGKKNFITKSGVMVGLGEMENEIKKTFEKLRDTGTEILTIGQYLQPSLRHYSVKKYYTLKEFDKLRDIALELGFKEVFSGPFVRSSYMAETTNLANNRSSL